MQAYMYSNAVISSLKKGKSYFDWLTVVQCVYYKFTRQPLRRMQYLFLRGITFKHT